MSKQAHKKGRPQEVRKDYEETVIQIDRVTRVVKGGRRMRFRATVVIGNRKGKVGLGLGKSVEVTSAIQKAVNQAKKNLILVPLDGETVPHDTYIKFKSSKIRIFPAGPGTGIIAGGSARKVMELAGIKNVLSKSLGSNNRVNCAKATIEALSHLRTNNRMQKAKVQKTEKPAEMTAEAKPEVKKPEAKKAATPKSAPAKAKSAKKSE